MIVSIVLAAIVALLPAPIVGQATPALTLPAAPAGLVPCIEEDGSTPGQAFPCRWDAATRSNGRGVSFTMWDLTTFDYS